MGPQNKQPVGIQWDGTGPDPLGRVKHQAKLFVLYLLSNDLKLPSSGEGETSEAVELSPQQLCTRYDYVYPTHAVSLSQA